MPHQPPGSVCAMSMASMRAPLSMSDQCSATPFAASSTRLNANPAGAVGAFVGAVGVAVGAGVGGGVGDGVVPGAAYPEQLIVFPSNLNGASLARVESQMASQRAFVQNSHLQFLPKVHGW